MKISLAIAFALFCFSSFGSAKRFLGGKDTQTGPTLCLPKDREGTLCPMVVDPVCGYKTDILCTLIPCNHITYSNACEACHDLGVVSYTQGACEDNTAKN